MFLAIRQTAEVLWQVLVVDDFAEAVQAGLGHRFQDFETCLVVQLLNATANLSHIITDKQHFCLKVIQLQVVNFRVQMALHSCVECESDKGKSFVEFELNPPTVVEVKR